MILVRDIQRAIATEFGVSFDAMREPAPRGRQYTNTYDVSHPRQAAIALSALLTDHSMNRIGHFFGGRDRKTVYHACAVVAKRRKSDPKLHQTLRRVSLELVRR